MASISDSEYRVCCAEYISNVLKRPSIYYNDLKELQFLLIGYHDAFTCMFPHLDDYSSFHYRFGEWLRKYKSLSTASGWAGAISRMAKETKRDEDFLFSQLVNEFLPIWLANTSECLPADFTDLDHS